MSLTDAEKEKLLEDITSGTFADKLTEEVTKVTAEIKDMMLYFQEKEISPARAIVLMRTMCDWMLDEKTIEGIQETKNGTTDTNA